MSLDVYLSEMRMVHVFDANITHNLAEMANTAGIYNHLWRPDEIGINTANELVEPLKSGLKLLLDDPEKFKQFNPENGWGSYDGLVNFVKKYIEACEARPNAKILVSR